MILRRNTGELVLSTEADLRPGYAVAGPTIHNKLNAGCYGRQPGPHKPVPTHKIRAWNSKNEQVEVDCGCRCHTRKGVLAYEAEARADRARSADPATRKFDFEGGSSMGVNLARRLRRVSPEKQRRLSQLDARIAKLQRERTAIIPTLWGDGSVLKPADLARIGAGTDRFKPNDRGPDRHAIEGMLAPKSSVHPKP